MALITLLDPRWGQIVCLIGTARTHTHCRPDKLLIGDPFHVLQKQLAWNIDVIAIQQQ